MAQKIFQNRYGRNQDKTVGAGRGQRRNAGQGGGRGYGGGGGGGTKPGSGPGGNCICPKCGHKTAHIAGQRCIDQTCPKCGTNMVRE
jgi:hypothetical protein